MANKYYAVRVGRNRGIFRSWAKCKALVDGFPGAAFKSFKTEVQAQEYLDGKVVGAPVKRKKIRPLDRVPIVDQAMLPVRHPKVKRSTYKGKTPPWDFPGDYIECLDFRR